MRLEGLEPPFFDQYSYSLSGELEMNKLAVLLLYYAKFS